MGGIVANLGGDFKRMQNRQFQQKIDTNLSLAKPVRNEFCPLRHLQAVLRASNLGGIKCRLDLFPCNLGHPVEPNFWERHIFGGSAGVLAVDW